MLFVWGCLKMISNMVSRIILGTVQMGLNYGINNSKGIIPPEESLLILNEAYNSGIRLIDTAKGYGKALEIIAVYQSSTKKKFEIINKFNNLKSIEEDEFISDLRQINQPNYYAYLFHDFKLFENSQIFFEIVKQKKKGRIKKIGVSVYTNEQFAIAINTPNVDIIQLPFNLLDNSNHRLVFIQLAKKKKIEIHVRSIFLQGLFFKFLDELPNNLIPLKPYLEKLHFLTEKYCVGIEEMAIQYALSFKEIDFVLIGIDSITQLKNNLNFANNKINTKLKEEIDLIHVNEFELLNPVNWK